MTVANTAIMLAQMELQVLVIDADLRKPSCHKALRVRGGRGLTDFLAGQERLDNVNQAYIDLQPFCFELRLDAAKSDGARRLKEDERDTRRSQRSL